MSVRGIAAAVILLWACGASADIDDLAAANRHLSAAPCGNEPAVSGVAGVNDDPHQVYIHDWVIVSVCRLDLLLKAAEAEQQPITLYMEGKDTGNEPAGIDLETGRLTFALSRNAKNEHLWRPFLYNPVFDPDVTLKLSAGVQGERALPRVAGANMAVKVRKFYIDRWTWVWLALLFVIMVAIIACAFGTDMLREGPAIGGLRRPYSLGRTQMGWWFFLIVISYNYIWLITGDRDTIPPSLMGLMGISAATALAATAIAARHPDETPPGSKGWWRDLIADEQGNVALDRLQIVVWTFVLSGVFMGSVIWELSMPEFNATLLALMGISSGTYIGFKLPQKA